MQGPWSEGSKQGWRCLQPGELTAGSEAERGLWALLPGGGAAMGQACVL